MTTPLTGHIDTANIQNSIATAMADPGHLVLSATKTEHLVGAEEQAWADFAAEWDQLKPDRYMADGGTYRLRRYSRFALDANTGQLSQLPHGPYLQSMTVNPLNGGSERHFDPCTASFCESPVLRALLPALGAAFTKAHGCPRWDVKLHPYRIEASAKAAGKPAPEGRHRDGVNYIMTMMIDRHKVRGGRSAVYNDAGEELATVTLNDRGEILMGDDRKTMHSVSPIHPVEPFSQGHRDVLVIAFTADPQDT